MTTALVVDDVAVDRCLAGRIDGPGFDPALIPDPTDPENLLRPHGRGLLLIQAFMDKVTHNETGNEIKMVEQREGAA